MIRSIAVVLFLLLVVISFSVFFVHAQSLNTESETFIFSESISYKSSPTLPGLDFLNFAESVQFGFCPYCTAINFTTPAGVANPFIFADNVTDFVITQYLAPMLFLLAVLGSFVWLGMRRSIFAVLTLAIMLIISYSKGYLLPSWLALLMIIIAAGSFSYSLVRWLNSR